MICNQDYVSQSCNSWKQENKSVHLDSSTMYLSLHNGYIAHVYSQCCDCKVGNCFCLLFYVCNFILSVRLNFVSPEFWCLSFRLLPVLPDMTGGPTIFAKSGFYSFNYSGMSVT